jgi:BED zinc finger
MATSSASSGSSSTSSNNNNNKGKGKGGRRQDEVWIHFAQSERDSQGHATATCNYCQVKYMRGEISILQGHIANHCTEAPISLVRKYQTALEENQTKHNKKRKVPQGQRYLDEYHDVARSLPQGRVDRIDRALIKFFVCCGVLFRVVESPFFIDLLKELNSAYNLPSQDILSNRLLESELGYVNSKVSKELDSTNNLTIGTSI